jgi:hypothetical protein
MSNGSDKPAEKLMKAVKAQIVCFLIIVGFSLADHGYFELKDETENQRTAIEDAEKNVRSALKGNPMETAEFDLDVAKANLQRKIDETDRRDAYVRAICLTVVTLIGAMVLCTRSFRLANGTPDAELSDSSFAAGRGAIKLFSSLVALFTIGFACAIAWF